MLECRVDAGAREAPPAEPAPLPEAVWEEVHVVVPARDEAESIEAVVKELRELGACVIVVDDGSRDGTAARAEEAGARVLRHVLNRGQGAALQTGLEHALRRGAGVIVTFDADGQHRVDDVPELVRPVVQGRADVALGSRFLGGADAVPPARRLLLHLAVRFTRVASGLPLTDTHNGLRALSRRAAERMDLTLDRMAHASELIDQIARARLAWVEVPVRVRYTPYSRAKGQRALAAVPVTLDYLLSRVLG